MFDTLACSVALVLACVPGRGPGAAPAMVVASPDGRLVATVDVDSAGSPGYGVALDGQTVLRRSRLGLVREDADFTRELALVAIDAPVPVHDRYEILTAKRRVNEYHANRGVMHLRTRAGARLDIVFQVSKDGVAFRYVFPDSSEQEYALIEEASSWHFLPGTRAWLEPIAVPRSGWSQASPSFEEYHLQDIPVGEPSPTGMGWMYPALFRSGDVWLLVSETAVGRTYAGTRLRNASPDGEYSVGFPDPRESRDGASAAPRSRLPWTTPWRFLVVGNLATIAESMLGVDLADPARQPADSTVVPGKASWSWPLLGDTHTTFEEQKRFIDYAAEMGWRYTLIDAWWDYQIGYGRVKELADYGRTKGVKILLWYNSAGDWNRTPHTPRDRLLTHDRRMLEFGRLKDMGVAGVKVDFFGGDGQSFMNYYLDILQDAEPFGLLLNFHGATLPRGWERTYPHLMTMEGVRGLEYVTFEQPNADREASHATMLPFTRNVFDPMDFTPLAMAPLTGHVQRRTTPAFELATAIVFTSGITHYAETPEGMAQAPGYVRELLRGLPSVWDDVKLLDGDPGHFVVLARRSGDRWYVAGINGDDAPRQVRVDLRPLGAKTGGTLITDGGGHALGFRRERVAQGQGPLTVKLAPRGGFVVAFPGD